MSKPRRQLFIKFALLCALLVGYFGYLSLEYGLLTGGIAAALSWSVVILSSIGTFLSIRFGDELMDVLHHRDREFFHSNHFKHELILFAFFILVIFGYYKLMASLGIGDVV